MATKRKPLRGTVAKFSRQPKGRTFRVRFAREGGDWIVRVAPDSLGVRSNGRTIDEARRNIRHALALAIGDAEAAHAVLLEEVDLPAHVLALIGSAKSQRAIVRELERSATKAQRKAAEVLTEKIGLSLRDAGELLGVTHAAVAKVLA